MRLKKAKFGEKKVLIGEKKVLIGEKKVLIGEKKAVLASNHLFSLTKSNIISLSNVLPSMVFDLTLLETRLLIYAIKHKDFDYNLYNIYCPITYDNLKKTIHSLAKKVMSIYENEDQWSDMPILSYATYNRGKCAIGLNTALNSIFFPSSNYFQLDLALISTISSIHTLKLFLLFRSIYKLNKVSIEFDRLQLYLCTRYKYVSHLERDVLIPAMNEMKELGIEFSFSADKKIFSFNLIRTKGKDVKTIEIKEYSELAKEMIEMGFIGNADKYIIEEGIDIVEKVVKKIKNDSPGKTDCGGIIRTAVTHQKQLLDIQAQKRDAHKKEEEDFLNENIKKYLTKKRDFNKDYQIFIDSCRNEDDKIILNKYFGKELKELPKSILKDFLDYRF